MINIKHLKEVIEREGRTRKWIAEKCGISPKTITFYLNGKRNPSKSVLKLLAEYLNTKEEYLVMQDKGEE